MKTRLLALILTLITIFSIYTPVLADETADSTATTPIDSTDNKLTEDKIEISLHIGSSVITINDKDITCEPPIIVNGTTMVPLRVISEAFGSTVAWDEATQGITLTYRDVVMKLIINDKNAKINDMTIEMIEAPVIYNDNTMVPLRFISENFGADVTYDDATQKVTVVKELTKSPSVKDYSMILKNTSKEIVGDSYYGWMINMPKNMKLTYRSFNGNSNAFTSDNDEFDVYIDIYKFNDDTNMDTVWANMKKMSSGKTLISQKREDKNGYGYAEMSCKTSEYVVDRRIFFKDQTLTVVDGARKVEKEKESKQRESDIITSFSYGYNKSNDKVEDLSDVDKDGYRIFKENKYKWSAKIPADWEYIENMNGENKFYFRAPLKNGEKISSQFMLSIYSKEDGLELSKWAERDRQDSIYNNNPDKVNTSELSDKTIGNHKAIGYKKVTDDGKYSYTNDASYLYGDEYRYQLNIVCPKDSSDDKLLNNILNSFSYEELDYNEIGDLAEPELSNADDKVMQSVKSEQHKINFKIPANWEYTEDTNGVLCHTATSSNDIPKAFAITLIPNKLDLKSFAKQSIKIYSENSNVSLIEEASITIGAQQGYYAKFLKTSTEERNLIKYVYFVNFKGKAYICEFTVDQASDGKRTKDSFDAIIKSITFTN